VSRRAAEPRRRGDAANTRDVFVIVLGLCGVMLGAVAALSLDPAAGPQLSPWRLLVTALSGAITATLLVDLIAALVRRRSLAALALRGALLLLNGVYLVGELLLQVITAGAG